MRYRRRDLLAYQMHRVFNIPVRPELSLDVLIAQEPHFGRQMVPVCPEKTAVEVYWWE